MTSLPHRIGAPYEPARNLAEVFAHRARDARVREAQDAGCPDDAAFWRGRAEAFEICANNLRRERPEKFQIVHQQQPDGQTCGQTCVAMLLGVPVADVIKVFGRLGTSTREMYYAMDQCNFWWNALLFEHLMLHGHYIAIVPSLNIEGGSHYVVIRKDENGETVFDPNRGRPGKRYYGPPEEGGVLIAFKMHLIYVCKSGWGGDWYDGALPELPQVEKDLTAAD